MRPIRISVLWYAPRPILEAQARARATRRTTTSPHHASSYNVIRCDVASCGVMRRRELGQRDARPHGAARRLRRRPEVRGGDVRRRLARARDGDVDRLGADGYSVHSVVCARVRKSWWVTRDERILTCHAAVVRGRRRRRPSRSLVSSSFLLLARNEFMMDGWRHMTPDDDA